MEINQTIAEELKIKQWQADAAIALIDEGCTIPFIARYRKEKTGELDDQVLRELFDRDRKSTRLSSSHLVLSRMPSSA